MDLQYPFTHDGQEIAEAEITRRPRVRDRITASREAKGVFGEADGDAVLLSVLSQVCVFGSDKKRIPADILADKLDYEDFMDLFASMAGADFFAGKKPISEPSSAS